MRREFPNLQSFLLHIFDLSVKHSLVLVARLILFKGSWRFGNGTFAALLCKFYFPVTLLNNLLFFLRRGLILLEILPIGQLLIIQYIFIGLQQRVLLRFLLSGVLI
jgi:hypothetical protein